MVKVVSKNHTTSELDRASMIGVGAYFGGSLVKSKDATMSKFGVSYSEMLESSSNPNIENNPDKEYCA